MVPDRHGAISWKRWIFCPTDHLDFENLENRRRYQNPGKPRTAGLCGREVVASDHLPLSCAFFRLAETAGFATKSCRQICPPHRFSSGDTSHKTSSPDLRPHWPHSAHSLPGVLDATSLALGPHRPSYAVTEGFLIVGARLLFNFRRFPTLFTVTQILSIWGYKNQTHTVTHIAER